MMHRSRLALILVTSLAACGGSSASSHDGGGGDDDDAPAGSDAGSGSGSGWQTLIGRDWSLMPGQETYRCTRIQAPEDLWIDGFHANSPQGTHHEVLTISDSATPLGDYDCNAGSLDTKMLFAAGIQTDELDFPEGVAIHVAAGQYLNLNLHLFDLTDGALADHSSVEVHTRAQADVVNEADMEFSGTFQIDVPSDGMPHVATGGCTAPADWHVFTLWPHMHQIATHQKLTVTHGGSATALLDDDYQFAEQKNYPIPDTLIHAGDAIQTTCTYVNNSGHTITFGESSTDEMCFTGMYKYPADGNTFGCTTGGGF